MIGCTVYYSITLLVTSKFLYRGLYIRPKRGTNEERGTEGFGSRKETVPPNQRQLGAMVQKMQNHPPPLSSLLPDEDKK